MAAKVAMVAVPTVLGIASIRVSTESPAPIDGLVTREKLNVYTPHLRGDPVQPVPDRPGVIEGGITTVRESLLPAVQTVKETWVTVRKGGVDLYHTGQDVFYYLKDPPPGFLPRFGTITMAGLLGMVLARKGSRFRRLAVPLGLMSAGASVCYPAQAVAVIKMTSRKAYAAGQWSSAAVSSLLSSPPPQEGAAAKETTTATESQPVEQRQDEQSADPVEAVTEASVQTGGQEAESPPVSVELTADTTTLSPEICPEPAPPEDSKVETEAPPPSEPSLVPCEDDVNEDKTQTQQDVSGGDCPTENMDSSEPQTIEVAKVQSLEGTAISEPVDQSADPVDELPQSDLVEQPPAVDQAAPLTSPVPPSPELSPPTSQAGGSGFKPDPSLLDFGQSSSEDEDLYTTRG